MRPGESQFLGRLYRYGQLEPLSDIVIEIVVHLVLAVPALRTEHIYIVSVVRVRVHYQHLASLVRICFRLDETEVTEHQPRIEAVFPLRCRVAAVQGEGMAGLHGRVG